MQKRGPSMDEKGSHWFVIIVAIFYYLPDHGQHHRR